MGVGAIVGGVKGANEAQREDVVDQTRVFLRTAIEDTDFTELLRARLASVEGGRGRRDHQRDVAGNTLATVPDGARVPDHFLVIEYRLGLQREHLVNPTVGIIVLARAKVRNGSANQQLHQATWAYCGARYHFVQMAANYGAALRAQIDHAAAVLAEAIPYDLYVSKRPRASLVQQHLHGFQRSAERHRPPADPAALVISGRRRRAGRLTSAR